MKLFRRSIYFLSNIVLLFSCVQSPSTDSKDRIIIAEKTDAGTLNPVAARDELSLYIGSQLYQNLLGIDYGNKELVGILATSRPSITVNETGQQFIHYQIRPEARFEDGRAVTAKDVAFSLKANVCPLVKNVNGDLYYGTVIDSIITDPLDSLSVTFVCNEVGIRNEIISGDFAILQAAHYDSSNYLAAFTYPALIKDESLEENESIQQFAKHFNQEKYAYQGQMMSGSGAYQLTEWQKGQRIILKQKKSWWGHALKNENTFFRVKAPIIQYEIIPDENTALSALKTSEVDFFRNVSARAFQELQSSESNTQFELKTIEKYAYQFIGFNLKKEYLKELNIRRAIAHALPIEQIIETVFRKEATRTYVPFSAQRKDLINDTLKGYSYDLEKSRELLDQDGWKLNEEKQLVRGTLKEGLELTYLYNSGNEQRKAVGLILQSELKKLGIQLLVKGIEWSAYIQRLRSGDFDLYYGGISGLPIPPDFYSAFHSQSANGGRNLANYQNSKVDALIDAIEVELNEKRRKELMNQFQAIVHQEIPYLYLLTPKSRLVFSRKLKNANIYDLSPNFWAPELSW